MILITGASSGIGEATAWAFAKKGKGLILLARREEKLKKLAEDIYQKYSLRPTIFVVDIRDYHSLEKIITHTDNAAIFSQVEVLVNNAGLAKGFSPFAEGEIEDWDMMVDTNIKGLLYITRLILPGMVQKGDGHIINIGSVAGYWSYPKGNVYTASKFAVRGLTESLRIDLLGKGVRVTEIVPGMVETEFSEVRLQDKEKAKAVYTGMVPLKAEDIAETILWSVERPKHVNIQEIVIYPTDQASPNHVHRQS